DFLPALAIGAFAGLRSAELERLEWSDVDLVGKYIELRASKAKTASRRIVPIADNLAQWLAPFAGQRGTAWPLGHEAFYKRQQETAAVIFKHYNKLTKPEAAKVWFAVAPVSPSNVVVLSETAVAG